MVCGWAGSLAGEDGINVISGTGSMTYGERQGRGDRVGGWGELFGDEGSAYWIAAQGLNAFSPDERRPAAPRAAARPAPDAAWISRPTSTSSASSSTPWKGNRSKIAALATTVTEAAARATRRPRRILAAAVDELVTLIEPPAPWSVHRRETVPVSYSGGMFSARRFCPLFVTGLQRAHATYDLRRPLLDPPWAPRCTPPKSPDTR